MPSKCYYICTNTPIGDTIPPTYKKVRKLIKSATVKNIKVKK